jgi:hypothetical protein
MVLIDIPFKGCQGRSNLSLDCACCVIFFACGVIGPACTVHAGPINPQVLPNKNGKKNY